MRNKKFRDEGSCMQNRGGNKVSAPKIKHGLTVFTEINPPIKTNVKCPYCEKMMGIFCRSEKMEILRCEDHKAFSGFSRNVARENISTVQPTTRASRNAGGSKKSRPALRKARDVV